MFKLFSRHTIEMDQKAIEYHYDLSNDFYKLMLDKNMVYSCAYFRHEGEELNKAQENKLDLICRKLRLKPGEKFLDIGCGWGALIIWAAKNYGVEAYGITNSKNQFELARHRIKAEGIENKCKVELKDYRHLDGEGIFDKIASVGMFEHVGIKKYPIYFGTVKKVLRERGLFLNHGITVPEIKHDPGEKFTKKYIFPHGELDTVDHVIYEMRKQKFEVLDVENLRPHYAKTLRIWAENLIKNKDKALTFVNGKEYRAHLLHVVGASIVFEIGTNIVYQILASKQTLPGFSTQPLTRADIYKA